MMTPQELIDLPGYGQANKRVKAMGMWRETMTDTDRIEWMEEVGANVRVTPNGDFVVTHGVGELYDVLRPAIDKAAIKKTAYDYEGYKCD